PIAVTAMGAPVTGISAVLTTDDPYITVLHDSVTLPDLLSGETAWCLGDGFRLEADPATPEQHSAEMHLHFDADQDLCCADDVFSITVQSFLELCPAFIEKFNVDPEWDIENSIPGGWEFGEPMSGPMSAYTGIYVYGTNLAGNYPDNGLFTLTSTSFDCTFLTDSELHIYRWLANEHDFDEAFIRLSTNGTSWTTLWSGYTQDPGWTELVYDVAGMVDGEDSVFLQFQLESDYTINLPGFYIDDVFFCGSYNGPMLPTFIPSPTPSWTPTMTPTITTTPGPSATPTITPTPSSTTPSPTPAGNEFTIDLLMNDDLFETGEPFLLVFEARCFCPHLILNRYIVLDVYGTYFFWPRWRQTEDYDRQIYDFGDHRYDTILTFTWPPEAGEADDLFFHAGCLDAVSGALVGNVVSISFGYR
ncbi:hypothetical protein JW905_06545, partial [bacterium]|nr:hypothetical protein [candidate division CSSED10-310 bacterium]